MEHYPDKLKLNNKTDQDILSWIKKHRYNRDSSVQGAIKSLIREDISRGNPGKEVDKTS